MATTVTYFDALGSPQEHFTHCPTVADGALLPSQGCICDDVEVSSEPHPMVNRSQLAVERATSDTVSALEDLEEPWSLDSILPGHKLQDVTTDRARAVGTLRTVSCSCSRTQWTASSVRRAVELHDTDRAGAVERAAVRAREEYRNALVLASRYGSDTGRVEAARELEELDAIDTPTAPVEELDGLAQDASAFAVELDAAITRTVDAIGTPTAPVEDPHAGTIVTLGDSSWDDTYVPVTFLPVDVVSAVERTVDAIGTRGKLWDGLSSTDEIPGRPAHIVPEAWATVGDVERTQATSEAFVRKLWDDGLSQLVSGTSVVETTSTDYRDVHPDEYAARDDYPCHICGKSYGH